MAHKPRSNPGSQGIEGANDTTGDCRSLDHDQQLAVAADDIQQPPMVALHGAPGWYTSGCGPSPVTIQQWINGVD